MAALLVFAALLAPAALASCDTGGSQNTGTELARPGEAVFARYCNTCHPGGGFGAGPSLILALPRLTDAEVRDIIRRGKTRMPGFSENEISDPELADLITYIRGLK